MTHEDLFQEYLDRDRGRIGDWQKWLAETAAAIERRLENALDPSRETAHELYGDSVPLAPAHDGWAEVEELRYLDEPAEQRQDLTVEHYPAFKFSGPTGNPALADLALVRSEGTSPTVIATERDDNPGASVTNGAEQLAAEVLTRLFPAGGVEPFRFVVHHRAASFEAGDRDFEALEPTFQELRFADFRLREGANGVKRIGDVVEWRNLDRKIVEAMAELKAEEHVEERKVSEAAPAARRSLRR